MESEAKTEAFDGGLGWRAHLVRDALIELLRELWGDPDKRVDALNNHVWDPDPDASNVKISTSSSIDFQQTDADIVFTIKVKPTSFSGMSESQDIPETQDGIKTFMSKMEFVIQCEAGTEELCFLAASETAVRFRESHTNIKREMGWGSMGIPGYSNAESQAEDGGDPFMAGIPVKVTSEHSYRLS